METVWTVAGWACLGLIFVSVIFVIISAMKRDSDLMRGNIVDLYEEENEGTDNKQE